MLRRRLIDLALLLIIPFAQISQGQVHALFFEVETTSYTYEGVCIDYADSTDQIPVRLVVKLKNEMVTQICFSIDEERYCLDQDFIGDFQQVPDERPPARIVYELSPEGYVLWSVILEGAVNADNAQMTLAFTSKGLLSKHTIVQGETSTTDYWQFVGNDHKYFSEDLAEAELDSLLSARALALKIPKIDLPVGLSSPNDSDPAGEKIDPFSGKPIQ